ncbi:MAG TPA: DUF58 domain-containing protein [Acidimicrobiales bacterium]|nr:DUF58 domain-containing protein [Acidimicrobiales bacterium]
MAAARLTRPGWTALWGGLGLPVAGRLMGIGELDVLGAVVLALVAVAACSVALTRLDVEVDRTRQPARVHVGQLSRVEVRVRNRRPAATPVLRLHEAVTGTAGVELLLSPLAPRARTSASYALPTDRRGILGVGPLEVVVADALGLAEASVEAAPRVEVTVLPRVEELRPVPLTVGRDPLAGSLQPHALGRASDDFYALRAYVVGDDLRRIHWPSTARHDELLVRQQEQPWQGRTTVLLDVRQAAHDRGSLEAAVSAAASVLVSSGGRRDLVRLVTTAGDDSGFGSGPHHLHARLEDLAVLSASTPASLRSMIDVVQRDGQGALVVVTGQVTEDELRATSRLRHRFGMVVVVRVGTTGTGADGGTGTVAGVDAAGVVAAGSTGGAGGLARVEVGAGALLAPAWDRAMGAVAWGGAGVARMGATW